MEIIPITIRAANVFVTDFHRHNKRVTGAKFAIGLTEDCKLIGVAIAGRPIARMLDNGKTIEILRVCVLEKYKNANSKLYGRVKRICQLMGYEKIITYTLQTESQASLKAIRAKPVSNVKLGGWDRLNRHRNGQEIYSKEKIRWEL